MGLRNKGMKNAWKTFGTSGKQTLTIHTEGVYLGTHATGSCIIYAAMFPIGRKEEGIH
jgi:hypothetical protein